MVSESGTEQMWQILSESHEELDKIEYKMVCHSEIAYMWYTEIIAEQAKISSYLWEGGK